MQKYFHLDTETSKKLNSEQIIFIQKLSSLLNKLNLIYIERSKAIISCPQGVDTLLAIIPHQEFGISICVEQVLDNSADNEFMNILRYSTTSYQYS